MTLHSPRRYRSAQRFTARTRMLAAAVAACYIAAPAWALPTAPTVINGSAGFVRSGNALTVTNSNGAIIHWNSFNIGANETTRFVQPSASSAVLNRVLSADPSQIYGSLTSNGRVWLINPAGVMVGPGGRIDTAGFVASTLNVSNQNFLAGRLNFQATPGVGNVVNQGSIVTPSGGTVYLVGASVTNQGIISTPGGEIILAAGQTVNLVDTATPGVKVEITGAEGNVTNLGEIAATAGRIGMAGVIVRNTGLLNASSVVSDGGRIFLKASRESYVDGAGRIVATGRKGGSVEVLGDRVAVTDEAGIDVSGNDGGGTVLLGGDTQGRNPDVRNASIAYFGPRALIKADASVSGNGGKVIVWADDTTRAFGTISARGGARGGNGGFVETSGHRFLDVAGIRVDRSAPNGAAGNWLLDPTDVTIVAGSGAGTFVGGVFDNGGGASSTVYAGDISSNLASGDVTITTASAGGAYGDIAMAAGAVIQPGSSSGSRTLTFVADRNISVAYGAAILGNTGTPLNVVLAASYGGSVGSVTLNGGIATRGGYAVLRGQSVTIGNGTDTLNVGINATTDSISPANSSTPDSAPGGRIMIDAGTGTFTLADGAGIGTSNQSTVLSAGGQVDSYGGPAIGIKAGDVAIASGALGIKLNYYGGGIASGGGGDLGFIPTSGSVGLGSYGGASFTLDNGELSHLYMPGAGSAYCGTGGTGCRIWIGNLNSTDPLVGTLPVTSQPITVSQADFTLNGTVGVPKRVHLSTTSTINDAGTGAAGGYYGIQAGHLGASGGAGIGTVGGDGLSFVANSAGLSSSAGSILAASVGTGDLALREVKASTNATVSVYGATVLLPHYAGQTNVVGGSFTLNSGGNISFAKAGQSFSALNSSAYGSTATFSDTAGATATVMAGGAINIVSQGNISVAGDHASGTDANLTAYGAGGISFTDAGLAALGNIGIHAPNGDISLTGVSIGTIVKSMGTMTLAANNIYLTGGNDINPASTTRFAGTAASFDASGYGAGAVATSYGAQTITANNGIVLRAGSANSATGSGNSQYGGSVTLTSAGSQSVTATAVALYGGVAGHDNAATIEAYGAQALTAYAGGISVYGGGTTGSFNNIAAIRQSAAGTAYQKITSRNGGTITLVGGNGTGLSGNFDNACGTPCQSAASSNYARIENSGLGQAGIGIGQEIDFVGGGTLALRGGGGGNGNSAEIHNRSGSTQKIWSSGGSAYHPTIVVTGGASGGIAVYGGSSYGGTGVDGVFDMGNSAGISAGDDSTGYGSQIIYARGITLEGGGTGDAANAIGGAYIGGVYGGGNLGFGTTIVSYGSVAMTGGAGNHAGVERFSTAAGIGNDKAANVALTIYGGDLTMNGGTGATSGALIGSMGESANVVVNVVKTAGVGGNIALTGAAGGVSIGSLANVAGRGAGTAVNLRADGTITADASSSARPAAIGSADATSAASTAITLSSGLGAGTGGISFSSYGALVGHSLNATSGNGISLLGTNAIDGTVSLTTQGAGSAGNIAMNLGSSTLGSIDTATATASAQTVTFYGSTLSLTPAIDMEGDRLALFATGNISFASTGRIFNAAGVTLSSSGGGIYNPNTPGTAVIDTSVYGGAIALTGTEIGLAQNSNLTAVGNPITVKPGTGTVSATATSGGINLFQTVGTLATGSYTLSSPAENHVHLRSANALNVSGALALPDNDLLLVAQGGALTQSAPITAASLYASAYGGIALTNTGNRVSNFGAYNNGSGGIAYKDSAALVVRDLYSVGYGVKNDATTGGGVEMTTLAGSLTTQADVRARGAMTLRAAGNLTQSSGVIANNATTGSSDISIFGADVTLRDIRSQRHVNLTATGALRLSASGGESSGDYVDDSYFTYNLPFAFTFYGVSYSQAYISSNGLITFGSGTSSYSDSVSGLGSYRVITPAWNDWELHVGSGKDIFVTQPTATSLAVQWNVDEYYNTGRNAKFEAVLSNTGTIRFNYGAADASYANQVTIGLSNGSTASTVASQLMSLPSFSLNNLRSTTFTPDGSGYTETVSATSTALSSTAGATSGGSAILGGSYSTNNAVTATGTLTATAGGAIEALSRITAAALNATSHGGATFTGNNHISALSAHNYTSGVLRFNNTASPLTLGNVINSGGNVIVDNTGAVVVAGDISSTGSVSITAHSPITVNAGASVSGATGVSLTASATSSTSTTDLVAISGDVTSASGNVVLFGASGITVDYPGSVTAPHGTVTTTTRSGPVSDVDWTPAPPVVAPPVDPIREVITSLTDAGQNPNTNTDNSNAQQPPVLPPTGAGSGGGSATSGLSGQTIGGGTGQFASSESSSSLSSDFATGSGSSGGGAGSSSSAGENAESSTTSGDSSKSAAGDKDNGKDSKDNKKDDKKSAGSSGDKKDDKSSNKKAVGKCSA